MKEMKETYKRLEIIYDQGTAKYHEDGLIDNYPFFGVIDSFSPPYSPNQKEKLYNGKSAGEVIKKIVLDVFNVADPEESLEEVTIRANAMVGVKQKYEWGISLENTDLLAGCAFAIAKIEKKQITILQGADCFSAWKTNDNSYRHTKIQNREYEWKMQRIIDKLYKKHKGDRKKLWNDFYQPLRDSRLGYINKPSLEGYCVLNGQPEFSKFWQWHRNKISTKNPKWSPKLILFCTDGLIPPDLFWEPEWKIAKEMIDSYKKEGLREILEIARKSETKEVRGYTEHCEATGMIIKF